MAMSKIPDKTQSDIAKQAKQLSVMKHQLVAIFHQSSKS